MTDEQITHLRALVAQNELDQALTELMDLGKDREWQPQVILFSSRWHALQKEVRDGLIYPQNVPVDRNRLIYSFLELLNEIDAEAASARLQALPGEESPRAVVRQLLDVLAETRRGFNGQLQVRDLLVSKLKERLDIRRHIPLEDFIEQYYEEMTEEERKLHQSMRHFTEAIIAKYNRRALELVIRHPGLREDIPQLAQLDRHLIVWLGKFEGLFQITPGMGLVYAGVKEKVPFPRGIEKQLQAFLDKEE
ncbi:MAG: hypothetical protein KDC54_23545 [Lewinella sp.]|nr:hypothetical protein [Lewinella sp.]